MYFTFPCPHCNKRLKVQEESAGRKAACPYCKASVLVPSPPVEPEPESESPSDGTEAFQGITASAPSRASTTRTKKRRTGRPAKQTSSGNAWSDRTNVSMLSSCLIGLVCAVAFLAALYPFSEYYFGELFLDRGWVPFVLTFLLFWSFAILVLKSRKLKRQKASMLFDLLPNDLSEDITQESLDKFLRNVHDLPVEPGSSFLINRVVRGLEHFRARNSNPEVATMLASHSELDNNAVMSSYTILNVFIWAIPILGFIGTVIGISAAVGGFSGALDQAQDISVLKSSLNNVTGGLATAFDTTLVALVMSMLVMFPTSSMQKSEEDLLNSVDEYCNENLLKRLNDGQDAGLQPSTGINSLALQKAINAAMAPHHAELKTWTEKLESIGGALTDEAVRGWGEINERLTEHQNENVGQIDDLDLMVAEFQQNLITLSQKAETVQQQLAEAMDRSAEASGQSAEAMGRSAESLGEYCSTLQGGLAGLNSVLAELGAKQVVIQAPPRRGWFFRRQNGE